MLFTKLKIFLPMIVFFAGTALAAHHYDANKPVTVTGTVKEVKWDKAYVKIHLSVKNAKGHTQDWELQTMGPTDLESSEITRSTLKKGEKLTATGDQEVDGSEHMLVRSLRLEGGKAIALNQSQNPEPANSATPPAPRPAPRPEEHARVETPQSGELPRTASNLPLIGLIGLVALGAAGLLAFKTHRG